MTENLAARGEGLAGLVAKWEEIAEHGTGTPMTDSFQFRCAMERCAAELKLALPAAAPAGTAQPGPCSACGDGDTEMKYHTHNWPTVRNRAEAAALATPSPQTPRTVLQQHQDKAISILRPYVCGSEFGECVALVAQAIADASPAATQKPAGSKLPQSFDARDWAKEFTEICATKGIVIEQDWMETWFANAIMAGYDHARAATQEQPAGSAQVVTDPQIALRIVGDWKEDSRGLVHVHKDPSSAPVGEQKG